MGLGIRSKLRDMGRTWRIWFARRYLVVSIGTGCDLRPGCVIECGKPSPGQKYRGISLGKEVVLCPGVVLTTDSYNENSGIELGDKVWINRNTLIQGSGGVTIGNDVLFGPGVIVWSSGHEYKNPEGPVLGQGLTFAPVHIKDGAWLGAGAIILPGVTVGEGAVVGAGSVVAKDVAPGAIVVGKRAEEIGRRGE
jgi:acetyltransferase-like isoleucine patch superfamily enzyme